MQFMLQPDIPQLPEPILYTDKILLIGSCFTEHITDRLQHHKFRLLSNPHGILFNPLSVAGSLDSYLENKRYNREDLFQLNELWNSWDHHTRFSHTDAESALQGINESQEKASAFVREADRLIVTLGSGFQYYLKDGNRAVGNNHRAPAQWFEKRLLPVDEIIDALSRTMDKLATVNPFAKVIFTISPVRHIRDGVIENNRSKARLIEAVHTICARHEKAYYFPAYELVIDVLRDYRYYDIDFVHPNYMATQYVWEQFQKSCISPGIYDTMRQVQEIMTARHHRSRFPVTQAHGQFLDAYAEKALRLMEKFPHLDLNDELRYFRAKHH